MSLSKGRFKRGFSLKKRGCFKKKNLVRGLRDEVLDSDCSGRFRDALFGSVGARALSRRLVARLR